MVVVVVVATMSLSLVGGVEVTVPVAWFLMLSLPSRVLLVAVYRRSSVGFDRGVGRVERAG